jgi:hypothetical protein
MSVFDEQRRKLTPREARDQAAEATGFLASIEIVVGDEVFEVPQRGLLDDDQRERMNELDLESESWDREPDITTPERRIKDEDGHEIIIIPSETRPGSLKIPYRKNGKLIKPSYPVQVAIALWGKEKYERFKAAGGAATTVTATLARLDRRLEERESSDPKSVASAGEVESGTD